MSVSIILVSLVWSLLQMVYFRDLGFLTVVAL